jgi:predicted DNA-binding protein with PD1-like motif
MWHYNSDKAFFDRLPHDGDLLVSIKEVFQRNGTKMGFFTAIGAVKHAKIGLIRFFRAFFISLMAPQ